MEDLINQMEELANGFEAAAAPDEWGCAITSTPFAVFSADFRYVVLVKDGAAEMVSLLPHLCGFSMFSREKAERIAEYCTTQHKLDWVVATPKEAAAARAKNERATVAWMRQRIAELETA